MSQKGSIEQPKKQLNTNNDTNIYNTNATPRNNKTQQQQQQQQQNTARQISPTRFSDAPGTRIARRELWWKEPPPSQVKIQSGSKYKPDNITPKVDHRNPNYSPARPQKVVESQRLNWNAQSAIANDTWANINHQPGGGNKKYPTDNLQWQATPKVDSGFIYQFE